MWILKTILLSFLRLKNQSSFSQNIEGELKTATILKCYTEKYYSSILVKDGKELPVKQVFSESTTISVDVGITDFVCD